MKVKRSMILLPRYRSRWISGMKLNTENYIISVERFGDSRGVGTGLFY